MPIDNKIITIGGLGILIVVGIIILLLVSVILVVGLITIYRNTKAKYSSWELVLNDYDIFAGFIKSIDNTHPSYDAGDNLTFWWPGEVNGITTWDIVKDNSSGKYDMTDNELTASTAGLYDINVELNFVTSGGSTPTFDLLLEYDGSSYPYNTTSNVVNNEIYAASGNKIFNIISSEPFVKTDPYPYTTAGSYKFHSCVLNKKIYLNTNDKIKFWVCTKTLSSNTAWGYFNTKKHPHANLMSIALL